MKLLHGFAIFLVLLLVCPALAAGQAVSATTGAINGKVTDVSGAVMPGATVTVRSPSMQGVRTGVTAADGAYRFPALPPGDYKITYELPGFATVIREGIHVGLGFTATVNIEMKLATVQETVTVSGASPVVDTLSTRTSTAFDSKLLAAIPSARDMWSVLAESPAIQVTRIDVGGSTAGTQTGYSSYDARGGQNRVMVDGLVTTEGTDAIGVYVDYGAFDEISVGTAAHSSDMGWPGVQTQFIAKSGGNSYRGAIYADYENKSIQSRNISAEQIQRGITFSEAMNQAGQGGLLTAGPRGKVAGFADMLEHFRGLSGSLELPQLAQTVMQESGYLTRLKESRDPEDAERLLRVVDLGDRRHQPSLGEY